MLVPWRVFHDDEQFHLREFLGNPDESYERFHQARAKRLYLLAICCHLHVAQNSEIRKVVHPLSSIGCLPATERSMASNRAQGGPLPDISGVITPVSRVITPVTQF